MDRHKHKIKSSPPLTKLKEEILLQIPNAKLHLAGDQDTIFELSGGDLVVVQLTEAGIPLATILQVGDLRWPLTKDEPVVKFDKLHYLFTIPYEEAGFLNYGVSFTEEDQKMAIFDQFLKENSCFSVITVSSSSCLRSDDLYWKDYAPNIEDYNGVIARAIAQGTGEIVKGLFKLSNAYATQVQKGGNLMKVKANKRNDSISVACNKKSRGINNSLKRVKKLSETTEKMSKALLDGILAVSRIAAGPLVRSKAANSLFSMVPGEILLASLEALNKVMDAVEFAERKAFDATSEVIANSVSERLGEEAGEVTEDVLVTAGHAIGTAWNVFKIRKAINPKTSITANFVNNVGKKKS